MDRLRLLNRTLQVGLIAVLAFGVLARNVSVVVNALAGFGVTLVPAVLARDRDLLLDPRFTLVVSVAVFLHSIGMVGLYDRIWWWDHLTHTFSATIVAVIAYTVVWAVDVHREDIHLPPPFTGLFVLTFVVAMGVLWEVAEFLAREVAIFLGQEPVLVLYGLDDSMLDLLFNLLGAVTVTVFATTRLRRWGEQLAAWLDRQLEAN
ncbi:hypothetical protein [Haloarchaeobius litoreus]|uniref:Uncharacterized protein n=1 Tax=Haloarchaeobius litoreus TaxID=755306 RepID=A0ABD6DLI6_9EURY|nr:hypothetical protein [Haloarchaeobius litoreus]